MLTRHQSNSLGHTLLVLLMLLVLGGQAAWAQTQRVAGTVVDDEGEPVLGATIKILGTDKGTVTDFDGRFALDAQQGQTLQVSYVGFKPQTFKAVADGKPVSIRLKSDNKVLGEVVVTALGITRDARSLSYARQSIDTESMTEARGTSLMDMLSGKSAGMQIIPGGGPTASTRVVLRGNNSLTGDNQPLYVVDGVPILNNSGEDGDLDYGNIVNSINPDDIENIEILKGANASALYGSDAANGVVLITTKKAKSKKGMGLSYGFNTMFGTLYNYPTYQNIYGAGQNCLFERQGNGPNYYGAQANNVSYDPSLPYYIWNPNMAAQDQRSWGMPMLGFEVVGRNGEVKKYEPHPETIKDMYQTSTMITNNVSIDKTYNGASWRFSYTNVHSDDIVKSVNNLDRHVFNLNTTAQLTPWLDAQASVRYTYENVDNRQYRNNSNRNPLYVIANLPRDASMDELIPWKQADGTAYALKGFVNPYWVLNETANNDHKNWLLGNVTLNVRLPYDLKLRLRGSQDLQMTEGYNFTNMYATFDTDGEYSQLKRTWRNTNYDVLLSYNKNLLSERFNINANVGASHQEIRGSELKSKVDMLSFPDIKSLANNAGLMSSWENMEWKKKVAVYGMASLGWQSWAYVDLTARNEWSSTLPKNNNSYFYWSAGAGLVLSEALKLDKHLFPFIKLRGSYAEVGHDTGFDRLLSGYYKDGTNFSFNGINYYMGETVLKTMGLKPERTRSWELGTDLRFLDDRVEVDFTYYNKVTRDQIVEADAPLASGYQREIINAGKMRNKGVELTLTLVPVKTKLVTWSTTVNWSKNSNRVLELSEGVTRYEMGSGDNIKLYAEVGKPYGVFYGNDYRRDDDGNILVQIADGRPLYNTDQYLGKIEPNWFGGWQNKIRIWDIDLSFALDFQKGGKVWSYTAYRGGIDGNTVQSLEGRYEWLQSKLILGEENDERAGFLRPQDTTDPNATQYMYFYSDVDRPKGVHQDGTVYGPDAAAYGREGEKAVTWVPPMIYWTHNNASSAARYIYDASYIKLREVSVGYNLPQQWLKPLQVVRTAKVSLVGRNLAILHQNTPKGMDPQATSTTGNAQGFERGFTLPMATYGFDVKVTF